MRRLPPFPTFLQQALNVKLQLLYLFLDYLRSIRTDFSGDFDASLNRRYRVSDSAEVTLPESELCKVGDTITLLGEITANSFVIAANAGQTIKVIPAGGFDIRQSQIAFNNDTVPANDTLDATVTLSGVTQARSPRFAIALSADLPDGILLHPLRVDGSNNIIATLENVTAAPIGSITTNVLFTAIMEQSLALSSTVGGTATAYGPATVKLTYVDTDTWQAEYFTGNFELA